LSLKSPANLTRILDRLTRKGFVERTPDESDRRAAVVTITSSGRGVVEEVMRLFSGYLETVMRGIGQEDEAACRRVLARIVENLAAAGRSQSSQRGEKR